MGISIHFRADTMNLTDMPYLIVGRKIKFMNSTNKTRININQQNDVEVKGNFM